MAGKLLETSFSKGEVTPEVGGRVDIASYRTSLATARNMIVRPYGGIYSRPGTKFLGYALGTGLGGLGAQSRLKKFRFSTTDTYMLEFGSGYMRVLKNDAFVLDVVKAVTGVPSLAPATVTIPNHGLLQGAQLQFDTSFVGASLLNGRFAFVYAVIDANTIQLGDMNTGLQMNISAGTPYVSGGQMGHIYAITTPFTATDLLTMSFVQSADVMTITVPDQKEYSLTRSGDAAWALTSPTFAPVIQPPTGVTAAISSGTTGGTAYYTYQVTAHDATSGEESLAAQSNTMTNGATPCNNTITWTAPVGFTVSLYSVYKIVNGVPGFIGTTPNLFFQDVNLAPDLSTTPPTSKNPFLSGNYPGCAAYYQQRLARAGSINNPDTIYFSKIGLWNNMSTSTPPTASDAMTITLTSREVNQVRHMVPLKADLMCFTAGQEWRITANGQGFSTTTATLIPQSAWGCSYLEPITIGLTLLFVRENGEMVRSARYTYLTDAYTGEEVSLLSAHLFTPASYITSWAFGQIPDPLIVCTQANGQVACLTYQEEQQISGWTRWDTDGLFENVEIARPTLLVSSLDDEIYFIVNRVTQGYQNVRTIEKISARHFTDIRDAFFVDSGLTYDNPVAITNVAMGTWSGHGNGIVVTAPNHGFTNSTIVEISDITWTTVYDSNWNPVIPTRLQQNHQYAITVIDANTFGISTYDSTTPLGTYLRGGKVRACVTTLGGLYHLEGVPVWALADGNVISGLTVTNGSITLPAPVARAQVGRQFLSDIGTQALEAPQGTIQGKAARVPFVTVRVIQTRGMLAGQDSTDLTEAKTRQFEAIGDPTALVTDDIIVTMGSDVENTGRVFLRQPYPLPMEILDIMPEIEVQD